MRLYLIRHAEPDYLNNTITPAGHLEAQALAKRLVGEGITKIFSSPLGRAMHTMKYTAELTGLEPVVEEWLQELDWIVDIEGLAEVGAWSIPGEISRQHNAMPGHLTWHRHPALRDTKFFSRYENFRQQSNAFMHRLGFEAVGGRYRPMRDENKERVAVFCHGGFGVTWLSVLLELPPLLAWSGFWLAPSSVTMILMEQHTIQWAVPRCLCVGDVSHLYEARLPMRYHALLANKD
jgi:broad specificity phosphatase PhoE